MEESTCPNTGAYESAPPLLPNEVQLCIHNFRDKYIGQLSEPVDAIHSDWKHLDNFTFRLMVFPASSDPHNGQTENSIGTFIEVQPRPDWPENWAFYRVQYNVIILNHMDLRKSIYKHDVFTFTRHETDRGWHSIASHQQLEGGFLTREGDLILRAGVYIQGTECDLDAKNHDFDSRAVTGFVGLLNHGATCYMNALIQGLYHIGKFRSWVFSLNFGSKELSSPHSRRIISGLLDPEGRDADMCPDREADALDDQDVRKLLLEEEAELSRTPLASLALQNLFYKLYFSREAPGCRELIKSFGWDAMDAFTQHDSHELLKLLLSKVEEQMKGTPAEGSLKELFGGEMETYIECIDIDYKSVRKESFEDIQLDVQGCENIYESLHRATEPEVLEGDNMYEAEGHGKQRARKGIRFLKFPNVCIFLLKRFTFNMQFMDTVKLNTKFEFYREIDLTPFRANQSSDGAKEEYVLQAVSVHQGGMNSGHYYTFCRTDINGKEGWLKFDDDKVYRVSEYSAIGDNFGGPVAECRNYLSGGGLYGFGYPAQNSARQKPYSAYILVYVKKSRVNEILCDSDPRTVNPEVVARCQMQERIATIRQNIRQRLSKFVKVRVFFKSDFINYRFLDQPFSDWREPGLVMKFERDKTLGEVLLKLSKVIAGYESDSKVELSKLDYDVSNFHILGLSADINRFEHLAQFDPDNLRKKDDYTPVFSGVIEEPIQELIRRINPNLLDPYDPTIYLLHFPFREDSFKLYHGPGELNGPSSNVAMLIIKYFDIFAKNPGQDDLICLDLAYVNADNRLLRLELPLIEKLVELMSLEIIIPYRMQELAALAKNYRTALEARTESSEERLYQELHETLENSGLSLCCYVETNGKCEFVSLKKTLLQHKIFTGDLLVFNFMPTDEMMTERGGTACHSKEDFEVTGEESTSSSVDEVFAAEYDALLFSEQLSELPAGRGGSVPPLAPPLPVFPVFDFPGLLDFLENRVTIVFRLYDPLQTLCLPVDCSGRLLVDAHGINMEDISVPGGLSSYSSFESDISDEDTNVASGGVLRLLPIITRRFELDLRCPVKKVLKFVCWNLKADPSRTLLYPGPPLLCSAACEVFSVDHFVRRDSSLGYEQVTLRELIETLRSYRGASRSKSPYATLHLCLLPWHYLRALISVPFGKFPHEDNGDRTVTAQVLNERVQVIRSIIANVNVNKCRTVGQLLEKMVGSQELWALVREEGYMVEHYDNDTPLSSLPQLSAGVKNIFAKPLRIEPAFSEQEKALINSRKLHRLCVAHQTQERETFGFAFMVLVEAGDNIATIKAKIREKVCVSQGEWVRWSFTQFDGAARTWKSNDDFLDLENTRVCFLAEHQMPYRRVRSQAIMRLV